MKVHRSEGDPRTPLDNLATAMFDLLDGNNDVKAVILLQDGKFGTAALHGYETDEEAMSDTLHHLQAMGRGVGVEIQVVPIPTRNQG